MDVVYVTILVLGITLFCQLAAKPSFLDRELNLRVVVQLI